MRGAHGSVRALGAVLGALLLLGALAAVGAAATRSGATTPGWAIAASLAGVACVAVCGAWVKLNLPRWLAERAAARWRRIDPSGFVTAARDTRLTGPSLAQLRLDAGAGFSIAGVRALRADSAHVSVWTGNVASGPYASAPAPAVESILLSETLVGIQRVPVLLLVLRSQDPRALGVGLAGRDDPLAVARSLAQEIGLPLTAVRDERTP